MLDLSATCLKNLKVAIVDDSSAFGAGLKALVASEVGQVEVFQDGRKALASFCISPPDILITDLEMPQFSGFQLVTEFRGNPLFQDIPVLVLSGNEDLATMAKIIHSGADGFIAKSSVHDSLVLHLLASARLREIYKKSARGKQFDAVKALIGAYKHDFGNAIAVIDGKLRKLGRTHPELMNDESYLAIQKWNEKLIDTLKKLDQLRTYEEQPYVGNVRMLKTG